MIGWNSGFDRITCFVVNFFLMQLPFQCSDSSLIVYLFVILANVNLRNAMEAPFTNKTDKTLISTILEVQQDYLLEDEPSQLIVWYSQ